MERIDHDLRTRLAQLEADGLLEDTIIFCFGDNGGALPRSKRFANDDGLRISLSVKCPKKWQHRAPAKPGSRVSAPVSQVGFPPTALALVAAHRAVGPRPRPTLAVATDDLERSASPGSASAPLREMRL